MLIINDPAIIANSVSAIAIILSSLLMMAFCYLISPQPKRWIFVYLCVYITGILSLLFHGFGETFPTQVADVGANLLLVWAMQVAILGDFYSKRTQWIVGGISGIINLVAIIWMSIVGNDISRTLILSFAPNSGFRIMQGILILDSFFAAGLLYSRHSHIPQNARPLLHLVSTILLGGTLLFASHDNHDINGVIAYHAAWHIITAFSFVLVWGFNQVRFNEKNPAITSEKEEIGLRRIRVVTSIISVVAALGIIGATIFLAFKQQPEWIAFESNRDGNFEIYIMRTDGSSQTRLTNNDTDDKDAKISRSGQWIVFTGLRHGNYEIYKMRVDGSRVARLTNDPAADSNPSISNDDTRVAFAKTADDNSDIYILKLDDNTFTHIVTENSHKDIYPSWSPDDKRLAFCTDRDNNCEIYTMNVDGTQQQNITQDPSLDSSPSWSPVGDKIAFNSYRDGNYEIYVINANGTDTVRLTNNSANDSNPHWSLDGKLIFFQSDRDGNFEIYRMNADGTEVTRLTYNDADDFLSP